MYWLFIKQWKSGGAEKKDYDTHFIRLMNKEFFLNKYHTIMVNSRVLFVFQQGTFY